MSYHVVDKAGKPAIEVEVKGKKKVGPTLPQVLLSNQQAFPVLTLLGMHRLLATGVYSRGSQCNDLD